MDIEPVVLSFVLATQTLFEIPISLSESDEDTSSDEDTVLKLVLQLSRKRKLFTPTRIENYVERVIPGLNAHQFQQHFRITITAYEYLLRIIGPQLKRQAHVGRVTIDEQKQILSVIWVMATQDSYRSMGERFNVAKSSLSKCFFRVVKILNALAPRIIVWPEGQKRLDVKGKFYRIARLPDVLGAVDGTYVPIKAPKDDPQSYITRKCQYAFTLQAIADPFLHFTDVFIGFPGSVSDNRIFRNSNIYRAVNNHIV